MRNALSVSSVILALVIARAGIRTKAMPAKATTAVPERLAGAPTITTIIGTAPDGGTDTKSNGSTLPHPQWAVMDPQWLSEDGDYDNDNNWHDAYWWHQNDPDFFYANHPEWISWQPDWRNQDGAYDAQHNWHYGQWWYNQNPGWVSANHPNWISQHRNWANHSEPQDHRAAERSVNESQQNRQRQASIDSDRQQVAPGVPQQQVERREQQNRQQQAAIEQNRVNEQNRSQAAATEQRNQANREQQASREQQNQREQADRQQGNEANRHQQPSHQQEQAAHQQERRRRRPVSMSLIINNNRHVRRPSKIARPMLVTVRIIMSKSSCVAMRSEWTHRF